MSRFAVVALSLGFVGVIAGAAFTSRTALAGSDDKPCFRTKFQTDLIKQACSTGGQPLAKKTMQKFLQDAKKKEAGLECKGCHKALAPEYPLKDDALDHFHKLGGK